MSAETAPRKLRLAVIGAFAATAALRLVAASRIDLMPDEAFYWACGRRLDVAFADHPPMTALLVAIGTAIGGHTPFGTRLPFVLLGLAVTPLVGLLARPIVGSRDAWLAAGATMLVPLVSLAVITATPEVPYLFFFVVAIVGFERATREDRARWWALAGLAAAGGLATHYRFALVPLVGIAYLAATRRGRRLARRPGPWLAAAIAAPGLIPALVFNLRHDFAPLLYQTSERHQMSRDPLGLDGFLGEQLATVTPLLWVALVATLGRALVAARRGDDRHALLAVVSIGWLGTFAIASPWSDTEHVTLHWPMPGYVPLLVLLPATLRAWSGSTSWRRALTALVPASGAAVVLVAYVELSTGWFGIHQLRRQLEGWHELGAVVDAELAAADTARSATPAVVADWYGAAAEVEFELARRGRDVRVYSLDHRKNRQHGRALQYRLWDLDETALSGVDGTPAVLVVEPTKLRSKRLAVWREHYASLFGTLTPIHDFVAYTDSDGDPDRAFEVLSGRVLAPGGVAVPAPR